MNRYVEELHNREKAIDFVDSILAFMGFILMIGVIGVLFWAAV